MPEAFSKYNVFIPANSTFVTPQLSHCGRGCCHLIDGLETNPEEYEAARRASLLWASEIGANGRAGGETLIECRRATA